MTKENYDFDVIVADEGVAGSVCAYLLAKGGHEVLLVGKGIEPGSKNPSGGVFYYRVMQEMFPSFTEEAPIEWCIIRNCSSFLNPTSSVNIDYWDSRLVEPVNTIAILWMKFDPWLTEQAKGASVTIIPDIKVDGIIREGGRFVGIRAGENELGAHVVVVADGIDSFISQDTRIRGKEPLEDLAVDVKSVIHLDEDEVKKRFNLVDDEGAAHAVVGDCTEGVVDSGFMCTNKESVSIGIVARLDDLTKKGKSSSDLHGHFLSHPTTAPFLEDGEPLEYGCHLVTEDGERMQHGLVCNGLVVIGNTTGFTLNIGFTVRGMNLVAGFVVVAATAVDYALGTGGCSRVGLERYVAKYKRSFVGKDMATYAKAPDLLENDEMYGDLRLILTDVLYGVHNFDLTSRKHILPTASSVFKAPGLKIRRMTKIGFQAMRSL